MTQYLRGKQVGIQKDFSAGLDPQLFAIDLVHRREIPRTRDKEADLNYR